MGKRTNRKQRVQKLADEFVSAVLAECRRLKRDITPEETTDTFLCFCALEKIDNPQDGALRDNILSKAIVKLGLKNVWWDSRGG